ncbi:hypothetical protein [Salinimonas iocasae]|uniref:Lipoprotein n=1 Tax=Salinimonas iocasae TaxID=2572577 RepID=A0A5B7YBH2_9ALTE|nr:hypothetical protein [Salinimonas iocasae]QCZ92845.1 hypothetical protein FBQ74_04815 [Salinimonas iocasae]
MRTLLLIAISASLAGCSQTPPYQLTYASQQIKSLQVLDAEAAINNDGITRELQGDYGKHAAENYRDSIYAGKEGREVKAQGDDN